MLSIDKKIVSVAVVQSSPEPIKEIKKSPIVRGNSLNGKTYRIKSNTCEHALYVTIANIDYNKKVYPYEIFFNTKDPVHSMWTNALTLLISSLFRQHIENGLNLKPIIRNLSQVYDSMGGYWKEGEEKKVFMNSVVAEIADCIDRHISELEVKPMDASLIIIDSSTKGATCPSCGEDSLYKIEGCDSCTLCGYSKCG